MLGNLITLLVLIALVVLLAWLTRRAWGSKHKILKWPALVLSGLLTLLFALIVVVGGKGLIQLYKPYTPAPAQVSVAGTPEQVARGEHLAVVLCASCHAPDGKLPLRGGNNMSADAGLPLGDLYPPNITPAGKIKNLTDGDIMRILRTGIAPDGRFTFMATVNARHLSDEDSKAVIAYLRHTPTVQEQTPEMNFSMLLALFVGSGIVPLDVPTTIQPVPTVPKAATREYGEYVVNFMDCRSCHGPTLSGDAAPPLPKSPNLRFIVPNWSKEDFMTAMRTGVDRNGHHIQPPMPWQTISQLEDVELAATYEYLHNLPAVEAQK